MVVGGWGEKSLSCSSTMAERWLAHQPPLPVLLQPSPLNVTSRPNKKQTLYVQLQGPGWRQIQEPAVSNGCGRLLGLAWNVQSFRLEQFIATFQF